MMQINPDPHDVADVLNKMVEHRWPTTEAERQRYFGELGLRDGEVVPQLSSGPDRRARQLTTTLEGDMYGISTMFRGEFLGLSLFCYKEAGDNGPQARAGFASLKHHLSLALGAPSKEWGSLNDLACLWRSGPLLLELYCFQRGSSGIMVGLAHADRSVANGAAARRGRP